MRIRALGQYVTLSGTPNNFNNATNVRLFHDDNNNSHTVFVSGVTGLASFRIGPQSEIVVYKLPADTLWTDGTGMTGSAVGIYGS